MVKVKKDLTGQRFGRLVVLEQAEDYINPKGKYIAMWKCRCDCGNITIVSGTSLKSNRTKSCGHCPILKVQTKQNLIGQRFGKLIVLERAEDHISSKGIHTLRWKCKCDCGNVTIVRSGNLKNGTTKSCGCYQKERVGITCKKYNQYDLSGEYGIGYTSKGEEFYFDLEDYDKIKDYCWFKSYGYIVTHKKNQNIILHRLIMNNPDKQFDVDHINHNTIDNRKSNLRTCTRSQNNANKNTDGVYKRNNRWVANLRYCNQRHEKTFSTKEEAIAQRKAWEKEFFGEYSYDESMKINT